MKNKSKMKNIIIIVVMVAIVIFIGFMFSDDEIKNTGTDTYTLMVYMCASDLESEGGYATNDIAEMLDATVDEKVNLIIETGGTSEWQNYGISNTKNQIYKVEDGELKLIEDDFGMNSMTEPENLSNFIKYGNEKYAADKYGLILWDHGGGAVSGYGYDEKNSNTDDTLTIDELKVALESSNVKFDFIGFDACLMANVETAFALKNTANYLIASEETEPGTGWDYTSMLNKLSSNTSEDTVEIGKVIVDSFIESNNSIDEYSEATLSVIDLSKIDNVFKNLNTFASSIKKEQLDNKNFSYISKAVSDSKAYGAGECDTIDLVDFAKKVNNTNSNMLINSINEAVVYNKTTNLVENSSGMSVYFPYKDLSFYEKMLEIYPKVGITDKYTNTLTSFVNLLAGGKTGSYTINSHTYDIDENYSQYNWYDENYINQNENYYSENQYSELEIKEKDDYYILEINDDDWENIANITCEVLYDDGEGYIDLGSDDYYEFDEDNNLKIMFDGTWISINGQTVPFYVIESTDEYTKGEVPAYLNDELVNIIIFFDEKNPNGKVIGAEPVNEYGNTTISSKGLKKIENGDRIDFLFDYYTYDGEFEDSYIVGDTLNVNGDLVVSYEDVGENGFYVYYKITDVYGNTYYTESIIVE